MTVIWSDDGTDRNTGAQGDSTARPPGRWSDSLARRMSSPPRTWDTETRVIRTRGHVSTSPERDHRVERGPASLEPAIGEDAGGTAVDFLKHNNYKQFPDPSLNLSSCVTLNV